MRLKYLTPGTIMTAKNTKGTARRNRVKNIVPDSLDLRDRLYSPTVRTRPPAEIHPLKNAIPVLSQGNTSACTGFALASVVHWLLRGEEHELEPVSPFMLYSMARRYDEFPGAKDAGSSLRGALKGWLKHGACKLELWKTLQMPPVPDDPARDWWCDAVRRPLGSYYRIEPLAINDMHVAIHEVGVIYASAVCHAGWDEGDGVKPKRGQYWEIPKRSAASTDGGHAFVIVGYNAKGFVIQNSWGEDWGTRGQALLTYEDWRENAMDCWVVQIGVVTSLHLALAQAPTLRSVRGKVTIATDEKLRNHEIAPFVVDMENNGRLSTTGNFRTSEGDVDALVTTYLDRARVEWGLGKGDPIDIAIYAHGGLTSEDDAASTAAEWIPRLYEQHIFPIFLMWETGLFATLRNIVEDWVRVEPRKTGGLQRWWDERLEGMLARPGSLIWDEMKENAELISASKQSGGVVLYDKATKSSAFKLGRDRLHLIGHSAGAIVHSHLVDKLVGLGWTFETVNLMAPAATVDLFTDKLLPHIKAKKVAQYNQWHLSDVLERNDKTCRPILGYGQSLLYLVSQSFEYGKRRSSVGQEKNWMPILGMEKCFAGIKDLGLQNVAAWAAQSRESASTTHGGFDNDEVTRNNVVSRIRASR